MLVKHNTTVWNNHSTLPLLLKFLFYEKMKSVMMEQKNNFYMFDLNQYTNQAKVRFLVLRATIDDQQLQFMVL